MARKLLALIAKWRSSEDAVFANRLSLLVESAPAGRRTGQVSPFRYVAPRASL